MISFDTNVLVYATASISDMKVMRARDLIARAMRAASSVLLLQTLAEFSNVAIRKARIPVKDIRRTIDAWRAVMPVQAADVSDLSAALEAVRAHRLAFRDAWETSTDCLTMKPAQHGGNAAQYGTGAAFR